RRILDRRRARSSGIPPVDPAAGSVPAVYSTVVRARLALALVLLLALGLGPDPAGAQPGPDDALLVEVRPPDPAALIAAGLDLWETSSDRSLALVTPAHADALAAAGRDVRLVRAVPSSRRKAAAASFGPGGHRGYAALLADPS